MTLVDSIQESYFGVAGRELVIGGIPVGGIAEEHGTPLFVYDQAILGEKWTRLRKALPERIDIFYSMKEGQSEPRDSADFRRARVRARDRIRRRARASSRQWLCC